ncbi:MAG: metal ABC transporter ATP-binding protein [Rhodobacteraceae bacterium]|jgi:zinc transport system ATP-binding protein|uniref:Zinc transport system ATP-binding protein n=1 Tax=Salipiger profundus TaxID=1229727 RepID=A0A1U7D0D7_9RHOB|nr:MULTISPECIES: metal ABC transporter ATP-binding protein [Salipiger]APX21617.1 zinc transport system ATP-binding protein [Salipiger profundus]MAB09011.1 metal ABC transporter ATP-binding protein [Paracoccaceae bacterium]GGA01092.1 zinc import ATP-binding protein ZnuC [Salipiger profundus]SFC13207.1 zinc transport system ATP-binding protein [Salipiger profundus]
MSLIEATGLEVTLGSHRVLSGVDFHVGPGEIVTIVGPNGSGKSTLLRVLVGALKPDAGSVTRKPGLRIGYVPQKLQMDPTLPMTVMRFLSLPRRVAPAVRKTALEEAGIGDLGDRPMAGLSGGQFQRVMLARALLDRPDVLLLDEPTQGLDQPGSAAFYRQIEHIRAHLGCAVVMVSHELHVVMSASDRVVCLNGHVCCQGHPEVVAQAAEYRALFGTGTEGALALYRHDHGGHRHDGACAHDHATGAPVNQTGPH